MAVAAVLVFHAESPLAPGGFLGVSLFFTLSGFLITSLLLGEREQTGSIALGRFYARRARRLLPAAYLCLAAVVACSALWTVDVRRDLPADVLAALANFANWRFALAPATYSDLFGGEASPVAHFWSLAIEEQLYLLLPLVLLLVLRAGRGALLAVTLTLLSASLVANVLTTDHDLIYNGTHTRAAELLVGVLLAQLVVRRTARARTPSWLGSATGVAAFGGFLALVAVVELEDEWLYRGGFAVVALVSGTLIVCVAGGAWPSGLLAWRPLVAVGRASYGTYLYHWPVFLILDSGRTGLTGAGLFALQCSVTALVAAASYHFLEMPIRSGRRLARPQFGVLALGTSVTAVIAAALLIVPTPARTGTEALLALGDDVGEESFLVFGEDTDAAGAAPVQVMPAGRPSLAGEPVSPVALRPMSSDLLAGGASTAAFPSAPADLSAGGASTAERDTVAPAMLPPALPPDVGLAALASRGPVRPRVLAVGSEPPPLRPLRQSGFAVVDATRRQCPLNFLPGVPRCDSLRTWVSLATRHHVDAVLVSSGASEEARELTRSAQVASVEEMLGLAALRTSIAGRLGRAVDRLLAAELPVVLSHAWPAGSDWNAQLSEVVLPRTRLSPVARSVRQMVASMRDAVTPVLAPAVGAAAAGSGTAVAGASVEPTAGLAAGASGEAAAVEPAVAPSPVPLRVLVIGDSTSLAAARAFAEAGGARLVTGWAGANGCPLARVVAFRSDTSGEWEEPGCEPFDQKLPPVIAEFVPDVVLAVFGPTELTEQQYPGVEGSHVPGSAEYAAFHSAEIEALVALLDATQTPLLVADVPAIRPGSFASWEMSQDGRLAALNEQIVQWSEQWPQVGVFAYRDVIEEAERVNGSVRSDGVHVDIEPFVELARTVLVDRLIEQATVLGVEASKS